MQCTCSFLSNLFIKLYHSVEHFSWNICCLVFTILKPFSTIQSKWYSEEHTKDSEYAFHIFSHSLILFSQKRNWHTQKADQFCKIQLNCKLTKTPILLNCQVPNGCFGLNVNFSLQILESKHLVCLSFWYISRDSRDKIYL